jgi:hypothetical protein
MRKTGTKIALVLMLVSSSAFADAKPLGNQAIGGRARSCGQQDRLVTSNTAVCITRIVDPPSVRSKRTTTARAGTKRAISKRTKGNRMLATKAVN